MKKLFQFFEFCPKKTLLGVPLAAGTVLLNQLNGGSVRFSVVCAALFLIQAPFRLRLNHSRSERVVLWLWGLLVTVAAPILQQLASGTVLLSITDPKVYLLEAILFLACWLPVFALYPHGPRSMAVGLGLFLALPVINAYTYMYRGMPLMPSDFLALGTAANVAAEYALFPLPLTVLYTLGLYAVIVFSLFALPEVKVHREKKRLRIAALPVCAVLSAIVVLCTPETTQTWRNNGAIYYGAHLNFLHQVRQLRIEPPESYDPQAVAALADAQDSAAEISRRPTILAVMDESFVDLSVIGGDVQTNTDITPFISGLQENAVSGYALSSVFGGGTANSEWEFLTGASMAWLPEGSIPYQQYVQPGDYTVLTDLKALGYRCISMHPYLADGWNRPAVYEAFGFDASYFLDDFPQKQLMRQYVSDEEMFDEMIRMYEERGDDPLFLFGITMQNHGPYTYDGPNYQKTVELEGYSREYPLAEQYLTAAHETDRAVEKLISYFSAVEDDVVIVFFGDHFPRIEAELYEELLGRPYHTTADQMLQQQVPFFVWANYDIPEQQVPCSSLNYLAGYMMEAAELPLSPYQSILREQREIIPAINDDAYYSCAAETFLLLEEAAGAEADALETLAVLQYNALFDTKNRNTDLFPIPAE